MRNDYTCTVNKRFHQAKKEDLDPPVAINDDLISWFLLDDDDVAAVGADGAAIEKVSEKKAYAY